jgi:hypothetical protein
MSKTVSTRETSVLTEQCSSCGLWYSAVHETPGGHYLCRTCLEVGGLNQPSDLRRWPR